MTEGGPVLPKLSEDESRAWMKAEDVAVHFNELIMNFRLKAIGAVTLAAGLVGTVLISKVDAGPTRFNYICFAMAVGFLAVVWLGIFLLDIGYYHRLLLGAVDEAIRLENVLGDRCQLSTRIKERAEAGPTDDLARGAFYFLPFAALVTAGMLALSWMPPSPGEKEPPQQPASGATIGPAPDGAGPVR